LKGRSEEADQLSEKRILRYDALIAAGAKLSALSSTGQKRLAVRELAAGQQALLKSNSRSNSIALRMVQKQVRQLLRKSKAAVEVLAAKISIM